MSYPVKLFHSGMSGAPTISDQPGSLIAALNACLLDGFGLQSIDSITRSGAVATVTVNAGHNRRVDEVVLISGANQAEYNGEVQILSIPSPTTYTYAVSGNPAVTATGVISHKVAPVGGWTRPYTDTNIAVYKSDALGATGHFFRVDDSMASASSTYAKLRGYTAMTAASTGDNPFPTVAQKASGMFVMKTASVGSKGWVIVADQYFVYLFVEWSPGTYSDHYGMSYFGDFVPLRQGDKYASIVGGCSASALSFPGQEQPYHEGSSATKYVSGTYFEAPQSFVPNITGHQCARTLPYPNYVNNGVLFGSGLSLHEGSLSSNPIRGVLPGLYEPLQNAGPPHLSRFTDPVKYPGKTFTVLSTGYSSLRSIVAMDISGPWR